MPLDLVIRNGTIVDGSGMGRYRADVGIADGRIVEIGRIRAPAQRNDRRRRPDRGARLHRRPHPHGRPGELGPPGHLLLLAWRHQRDHGQLRLRARPVPAGRARMVRALPDRGGGHPAGSDARRHRLALGDLPGISRHRRTPAEGAELRRLYRPFGAAHVRDGQARADRTGNRGRHRAHGARGEGSGARRRDGIFQLPRRHPCHAGRHARGEPDRGMERDRCAGRRDGGTGCGNLPDRA